MTSKRRIPPLSPYGLLQEYLFPNEWLCHVACVLLNRTSRKQVESVIKLFIERWSTPESVINTPEQDLAAAIKSLGFSNRRARTLKLLAEAYVRHATDDVSKLPGIGAYAASSWRLFFGDGRVREVEDHALALYSDYTNGKHNEKDRRTKKNKDEV